MKKDTYFFSHDFHARQDPKLIKVLMKLGQEGKGVYWDLIEMLYEQGGYLPLSEIETYTFVLHTKNECITSLINDFDLFTKDSDKFWSESVLERLNIRKEKSEQAKGAIIKRWDDVRKAKALKELKDLNNTESIRAYNGSNTPDIPYKGKEITVQDNTKQKSTGNDMTGNHRTEQDKKRSAIVPEDQELPY